MLFFTCASGVYKELIPIYEYCVHRAYPDAKVKILETDGSARDRFLIDPIDEYVHVTDIDILILPKDIPHEEYYGKQMVNGASYLRGATVANGQTWDGARSRICGGHIGFTPEYYEKTREIREFYSKPENCQDYREFDEVMLYRILDYCKYPIPKDPYTFPSGDSWDKQYRDLHINDFWGVKYLKWAPDKKKVGDLMLEPEFKRLCADLSPRWLNLINLIVKYSK